MTSTLRITRRAADRLRAGHLWVYRSDIEQPDDTLAPGALVTVVDNRKIPLGDNSEHITTHYSAPEIGALIEASENVRELRARKGPHGDCVSARPAEVSDLIGRKGVTRGLDPGTQEL